VGIGGEKTENPNSQCDNAFWGHVLLVLVGSYRNFHRHPLNKYSARNGSPGDEERALFRALTMGVCDSHSGEDRAILCQRKKPYENARKHRPDRWFRKTTRNWTPVTFTSLNPTDSRILGKTLKKSA